MNGRCLVGSMDIFYPFSHNHGSGKMGAWKMTLVSKGAIFHFHGYGRKGKPTKEFHDTGAEILEGFKTCTLEMNFT